MALRTGRKLASQHAACWRISGTHAPLRPPSCLTRVQENGSKPATLLLVVFRPDEMPAFNLDSSSRVYVANTSPPSNRIWRPVSHSIGLNPALALIAGMEVLRCAYWPPPDRALRGLEADTKTFRDEKNIQMYPDMASEFVY